MSVYVNVHVHVGVRARKRENVFLIQKILRVPVATSTNICMYAYMQVYVCIFICIYAYMQVYVCIFIHTYTLIYTRVYI